MDNKLFVGLFISMALFVFFSYFMIYRERDNGIMKFTIMSWSIGLLFVLGLSLVIVLVSLKGG